MPILTISLPLFLYAEIHYRPRFLRGFLYRKQPEIIFDIPQRIETDELPVALIIKDSHKFPIELQSLSIDLIIDGKRKNRHRYYENKYIDSNFFSKIFPLKVKQYQGQYVKLEASLKYKTEKKEYQITNNNYPLLKNRNLSVYIDPDKRPQPSNWKWGDMHCHSHYTEDQVEFGLPLHLIPEISRTMGLSFVAVTDHSYDLNNGEDSWIGTDVNLTKWYNMQKATRELNSKYKNFVLLPGEEVSTDNGLGKTVHMLVINNNEYIPGSGDSFEDGIRQKSELQFNDILDNIPNKALALAAHPFETPSRIQSFFLKRGEWNIENHHPNLAGYQILNGKKLNAFKRGKKKWIAQLLKGKHKYIYAGNDSHGFLNRFISIQAPLISLNNSDGHIFGEMLTAVKNTDNNVISITKGLQNNPVIISNGPFLEITIFNRNNRDIGPTLFDDNQIYKAEIGETLKGRPTSLQIKAESIPFFGKIKKISSYLADHNTKKEVLINTYSTDRYNFEKEISLTNLPKKGYIRSELITSKEKFTLTNPVWFEEN
ncbi:MAG: hypothetical protein K9M80_09390 [Candidatus Marinimicrobia bacterium]|nr:hypothetical protein [Candidatus Neomarinimicrobiota bacterium]